jgi:hypothetical protein
MSESFSFNSRGIEPSRPREDGPIPNGIYRMWIVASEIKPTKKGDGKRLELELDVLDGEHKGRKVWEGLNIQNPNAQAQEIALRDLAAICQATGVLAFTTPQQLHRKVMLVKVGTEKRDGYKDRNIVLGYLPITAEKEPVSVGSLNDDPRGLVLDDEDDNLPF